jgi:enoyl-CoA hydratase
MTAKEAESLGLITKTTSPEVLFEEASRFAERLAKQAPLSLRLIKDSVIKAEDLSLYDAMQAERKNFYLLFSSNDQKEGMKAFIEKRPPAFRGE